MKRFLAFAGVMALVIGLAAWVGAMLASPSRGQAGVNAVVASAGVAFSVQLLTFGIANAFVPTNIMAGWAAGMLVQLIVLAMHALFGARLLGLPVDVSLISLAAFFFLSTLIEPFFLARPRTGAPRTTS